MLLVPLMGACRYRTLTRISPWAAAVMGRCLQPWVLCCTYTQAALWGKKVFGDHRFIRHHLCVPLKLPTSMGSLRCFTVCVWRREGPQPWRTWKEWSGRFFLFLCMEAPVWVCSVLLHTDSLRGLLAASEATKRNIQKFRVSSGHPGLSCANAEKRTTSKVKLVSCSCCLYVI